MKDIQLSSSFSKGYLMIGGTLLLAGVAGMVANGFKMNKNFTILFSVAGLIAGSYLTIAALKKVENPVV